MTIVTKINMKISFTAHFTIFFFDFYQFSSNIGKSFDNREKHNIVKYKNYQLDEIVDL